MYNNVKKYAYFIKGNMVFDDWLTIAHGSV